jgi:exopolyphosphatase/guanosine-5'-triphosphate,3'-diphosphate pyrophosphatase
MNHSHCDACVRVASIDVGTNSIRLLVADLEPDGALLRVFTDRCLARLGEGLQRSGSLSEAAMERAVGALISFVEEALARGVRRVLAAGTSAVRDSRNGQRFVTLAQEATGLRIQVLSGEQEAQWMMRGVSRIWKEPPPAWVALDVGGGSTELIRAAGREAIGARSLPLGMVRLTEELLAEDPPIPARVTRCREMVRETLRARAEGFLPPGSPCGTAIVGTAGAVTTMAALDQALLSYDVDRINGYNLRRNAVREWSRRLAAMSRKDRKALPGMEPGREDVILAGAVIAGEIMDYLGGETMLVSDFGLLEGIALMAAEHGQRVASDGP